MAIEWKVFRAGFLDGYTAIFTMFTQVKVPGSSSEELIRLTTPDSLAQYRAINPNLPGMLIACRDQALDLDRRYAQMVRVIGCLELAGTALAIYFLAVHYRL